MKTKLAVAFLILLGLGGSTLAQGIRLDATTVQEMSTTAIPGTTNVLTVPAAPIVKFCNFPANAVPCTNLATTFTSSTLGTPCNTSTQITLVGSTTCVASPDANGNFGFWAQAGQYAYTVTLPGGINLGPYNVTLGIPSGTALPAITVQNLNDILWVGAGAGSYNTIAAAVTAAGTVNHTIIALRSTFVGTCPASTLSTTNPNIVIWDFSGLCLPGTPTSSYNGTSYNMFDGNVLALQRSNFGPSSISAAGALVNSYFITATNNLVVGTGNTVDGVSAECDLFGNQTGTLPNCTAAEHNVSVQSALGTVTNAFAGVFAAGTFNSSGNCFGSANCTAVTNMGGGHFFGCRAPLGAVPVNCYGAFFEDQLGRASARNYSAAFGSKILFVFSANSNAGGADCEDPAHVTHPCLYVDGTGALNMQAPSASSGANGGLYFERSTGGVLGRASETTGWQFLTAPTSLSGVTAALTGTGACATITTQTGGEWAGRATCTAATAASTLTITPGTTAPNGWVCAVQDQTTRANLLQQTSTTATACTLTATSITQNDVFVFTAIAF